MIDPLNRVAAVSGLLFHPSASRKDLVKYQNRQLRRLINHAYRHVPYYRQLFDRHGVSPGDVRTVDDLWKIPITSRSTLQALSVDQVVAKGMDPDSLIVRKTSGSSGRPMVVRRTWTEERLLGFLGFRALRSYGLHVRDRHCYVMSPRGLQAQDHQLFQGILHGLGVACHDHVVSCFQTPEEIFCELEDYRPDAISGFPVVLARMAQLIHHDKLRALKLRFVGTGGEVLTPLMRWQIEEGFHAPVCDTYGSHEFHLLAWQCRMTKDFHVCDDGMILEVVRDDQPVSDGESGEVVGTNLHAFAMPLIRYRLGDLVTKGYQSCRCGQPFSTIRALQGRMRDYFIVPDGRLVHPYEVAFVAGAEYDLAPWIREFQITQEREDCIVMRVVPFYKPSAQELDGIQKRTAAVLGSGVRFQVQFVHGITLEPNGKFRVYRSLVQSPYDSSARGIATLGGAGSRNDCLRERRT
jgi:phenylacetate-coenzyme A ligase PaaK-like adenylate-forming protein